jgi:hypothetical protein
MRHRRRGASPGDPAILARVAAYAIHELSNEEREAVAIADVTGGTRAAAKAMDRTLRRAQGQTPTPQS